MSNDALAHIFCIHYFPSTNPIPLPEQPEWMLSFDFLFCKEKKAMTSGSSCCGFLEYFSGSENWLDRAEAVPLCSGTAPPWICRCRWEPRGRRLGPGAGAGGGTGGSTSHWGTGWSPPQGAGPGARTPPSGNPQGPVRRRLPAPQRISTDPVLPTFNPQRNIWEDAGEERSH